MSSIVNLAPGVPPGEWFQLGYVWHGVGNVETFTPPHSVIYSGVALAIGSTIGGIIQAAFTIRQKKKDVRGFVLFPSPLPLSLKLAAIGVSVFLLTFSSIFSPLLKIGKPWPGFGPGTFALPRQRSTRLSYQGTNTPIRNEVMELHLKHIESSLNARQDSKSLLEN
jgi:hypothetical protein